MAERTHPRRGEIWSADDNAADLYLVISSDDWNRRHVASVLAVPIEFLAQGANPADTGPYATVIDVQGRIAAIYADEIIAVRRDAFGEQVVELDGTTQGDVDESLRDALTSDGSRTTSNRPKGHPYAGQIRFADLYIEGEGDKPVVVVSSEAYGAALEYALVIVCRKTSNPGNLHDYDVLLRSQTGKVVCSDVRTVRSSDVRERTTTASALTTTEKRAVLAKVHKILGLED